MIVLKILLTILKILGFILAGILALLIFIILSVLLYPIRYKGYVKYKDEPVVLVKANWLYHILSVKFALKGKETRFQVKIFSRKFGNKKKKSTGKSTKSEKPKTRKQTPDLLSDKKTDAHTGKSDLPEIEPEPKHSAHKETPPKKESKRDKPQKNKPKKNIKNRLENLKEKIAFYAQKREELLKEAEDESNRKAVSFAWMIVKKLIKHSMPHSHHISIVYGTGDPAKTGENLGIMYAISALIGLNLVVTPDFDNKIFECEADFKGKIILLYIGILALKVYKNKDFKQLINKIKER